MADIKKQLGQRIKYLRKNKGLNQEQLSEMLDLSPRSIGNIETGRVFMSLSNLEKFIEILGIEPYELFIFDKEPPKDIIFNDVIQKIEKIKDDNKKLYALSAFIDNIS